MGKYLSWVEIDKKALFYNISQLKKLLSDKTKLMTVVKGNAYGHGISEIANIINNKIDWLGVNSLDEAILLKKSGIVKPILILGYTQISRLNEVVENNFRQVVYNKQTVKELIRIGKPVKVHIKIETGTNRQGIDSKELLEILDQIKKSRVKIEGVYTQRLEIEGISTHFATLEEEQNAYYKKQLDRFQKQLALIKSTGVNPKIIHTASSAAAILYRQTHFDMVRVGIGLYGLWPSELVKEIAKKRKISLKLKPVLIWKTRFVQIKTVEKGETIGYGRIYKADRDMQIAILPIGYYDGYDRRLSNNSQVLIDGQFANVIGRVMMNMIIVDVTKIKNIKVEDEVILIGKSGVNEITAKDLAEKIGTINYEVVTRINPQIPRVII